MLDFDVMAILTLAPSPSPYPFASSRSRLRADTADRSKMYCGPLIVVNDVMFDPDLMQAIRPYSPGSPLCWPTRVCWLPVPGGGEPPTDPHDAPDLDHARTAPFVPSVASGVVDGKAAANEYSAPGGRSREARVPDPRTFPRRSF